MYQKVMVPLDGSELAECVLPHVETLIRGRQVDTVIFVRVVEPASMRFWGTRTTPSEVDYGDVLEYMGKMEEERKSHAAQYLQTVVERLKGDGVSLKEEVLVGRVADCLVDFAEERGADLIVIATHGRSGVSRWVRGSVAERILRASKMPVLIVRAPGTLSDER